MERWQISDKRQSIRNLCICNPRLSHAVRDMAEEVVVRKGYALVIPKRARAELDLKEGQQLTVRVEDGRMILEPLRWDPCKVLEEIITEPYEEGRDEARAEEWLKKQAGR